MTQADTEAQADSKAPANGEEAAAGIQRALQQTSGRRPLVKVILAAVFIIAAVIGIRYLLHAMAYESTDDAYIEGHIVQVSPRVTGHVQKVYVDDNELVKQGQPLVELDPADYQARLAQAKAAAEAAGITVNLTDVTSSASVQQAQAAVESAKAALQVQLAKVDSAKVKMEQTAAQVSAAAAALEQAKAQVNVADAQTQQAQADVSRYEQIAKTGGVTQQDLDKARTVLRVAESQLDAARKGVIAAEAQLTVAKTSQAVAAEGLRQEQAGAAASQAAVTQAQGKFAETNVTPQRVDQSQASYEQLRAAADLAQLQLNYTKIYAPESGRVTKKSVEPGEYVQVGQPLMAIVPDHVWIVANYKETQLTKMKVGQLAEVYVDAYPGHTFKGHVDSLQAGTGAKFSLLPPENATGNFVKVVQRVPVKIVLDEQPSDQFHLGPGMSVIAEVRVK